MSLIFNGTEVKTIIYNDKNNSNVVLDKLIIDSTLVYTRSLTLKVAYGSNVSSVKVNNSTISNGGTFEYQSGQTLSIVVTYNGYATGDGYIHSVNNNTTVDSTRWKYNTNYTISGISKTVSVSNNLSTTSDTISFSLTDTEINNLLGAINTITFNATKTGEQTYKVTASTTRTFVPEDYIITSINKRQLVTDEGIKIESNITKDYIIKPGEVLNIEIESDTYPPERTYIIGKIRFDTSGHYNLELDTSYNDGYLRSAKATVHNVISASGDTYFSNVNLTTRNVVDDHINKGNCGEYRHITTYSYYWE